MLWVNKNNLRITLLLNALFNTNQGCKKRSRARGLEFEVQIVKNL